VAGWNLDLAALISLPPGTVGMKANTALTFIALGLVLRLLAGARARHGTIRRRCRRRADGTALARILRGSEFRHR
jgi:hypothetical protein